jgi:hypothetical protein
LKAAPGKKSSRPYLEKTLHRKGLVEWFKVKALSSSPSTKKKKCEKLAMKTFLISIF